MPYAPATPRMVEHSIPIWPDHVTTRSKGKPRHSRHNRVCEGRFLS